MAKKRNRKKSIWPKMICPNAYCVKTSTPLEETKTLVSGFVIYKDGDTGEIISNVPHSVQTETKLRCRHCKAIIWVGKSLAVNDTIQPVYDIPSNQKGLGFLRIKT